MNNWTRRKISKTKELLTEAIKIFENSYYEEDQEIKYILEQTMVKIKNVENN